MDSAPQPPHLPFNFTIGVLDGAFFGLALGFGSFVAVIPLFIKGMTDSAILIGLVPSIHTVGWQLPQLFTAGWVSRAQRYKPLVLLTTVHERIPFLGMAVIAWFLPQLGAMAALPLMFVMMVWQGIGGGMAANAWQSMITKVIPSRLHGTFFGVQSAAFNGLGALSAVASGLILERLPSPLNFTLCFALAALLMAVSFFFIAQTKEELSPPRQAEHPLAFWGNSLRILKQDRNFLNFLWSRVVSQLASTAFAFYIIYAVIEYDMSAALAGVMTGVLLFAQVALSPLMGRLGDRWSHRAAMFIGALAASLSALLAWQATSVVWFYAVFVLEAAAIVAFWISPMALTVSFAPKDEERPLYIGLSNTITALPAIAAPVIGGWIADTAGYHLTFLLSAACGLVLAAMLAFVVKEPRPLLSR
jgi:MFS family permease